MEINVTLHRIVQAISYSVLTQYTNKSLPLSNFIASSILCRAHIHTHDEAHMVAIHFSPLFPSRFHDVSKMFDRGVAWQ